MKRFLSHRGDIEIIAALVAGAILVALLVSSMRLSTGLSHGVKNSQATLAVTEITNDVKNILNENTACANTFNGIAESDINVIGTWYTATTQIRDAQGVAFMQVNEKLVQGNVELKEIAVGEWNTYDSGVDPNRGSFMVRLRFERTLGGGPSQDLSREIIREFKVDGTLVGGAINTCTSKRVATGVCTFAPAVVPVPTADLYSECPVGSVALGHQFNNLNAGSTEIIMTYGSLRVIRGPGANTTLQVLCCPEGT